MRWASFEVDGNASWGIVRDDGIVDAGARHGGTLGQAIAAGRLADAAFVRSLGETVDHPLTAVRWLPVITDAPRYFCVGLNYRAHQEETGRSTDRPLIFMRFPQSQVGHGEAMIKPRESEAYDWEGEIAVIIGTGGRRIRRADALAHILGFAPFNEGSVRDYQRHTTQYTAGKNFERSGAFGPWMMTADEVGDFDAMEITTRRNGEVMQNARANSMIFGFAELIEYLSTFTTLLPADVIVSGTPAGVGAARKPPIFMQPGDRMEVEVAPIGTLVNSIEEG